MKNRRTLIRVLLLATVLPALGMGTTKAATVDKQANPPVITEGDVVQVSMSEDGAPIAFSQTLNATDADMDPLTWVVVSAASHGTATVTGAGNSAELGYTPTPHYNGTDSFGIQVSDGTGGSDLVLINVMILPVNDPPVIAPIGNRTVNEGEVLLFAVTATDPDNETPVLSASNLPPGASFDPATGAFSWTPGFEDSGIYEGIVFTATDGGDDTVMVSETIAIQVNGVNRPPVLNSVANREVREESTLTLVLSGSDPDGNNLTFFMEMLPEGAVFNATTATLTYTPALGAAGEYAALAGVTDDGTPPLSDTQAFVITVNALSLNAELERFAEVLLADFATADGDGNGFLTLEEARTLLPNLQESRFEAMDANSDGRLSEDELLPVALTSDTALESAAGTLLGRFESGDTNGDGLLSEAEAGVALRGLTAAQFDAMDEDEDGFLTEHEISVVATAREVRLEMLAEDLLADFDAFDIDASGSLDRDETEMAIPDLFYGDFVDLDLNNNDLLSESELTTTALTGDRELEEAAEIIAEFFYEADSDGDGLVSRDEAVAGVSLTLRDFEELDTDGDGFLSEAEVEAAAAAGDEALENAAEQLLENFSTADADNNGFLSRAEAATILPGLTLALFQELDANGDGRLSRAEVNAAATFEDPVPLAPVIVEGVLVDGITEVSALVTWKTQVPSNATVRYGTDPGVLNASTTSASTDGDHQVTLSGLMPNTTYHVRVDSVHPDDTALTGSSRVTSFITAGAPDTTAPVFVGLPALAGVSDTSIHLVWSTDETAFGDVVVDDGTTSTTLETPWASANQFLTVDGLTPDTDYALQVTAMDASGNTTSVTLNATTRATPDRAPTRIIDGVLITRVTDTTIGLRWRTDKPATTEVAFSEDNSLSVVQSLPGLRRDHLITLVGLRPGTDYSIETRSTDWLDNGTARGTVDAPATRATAPDDAPVFVAAPRVIGKTDTTAILYWETDHASDSQVTFQRPTGTERSVQYSENVLAHQVILTNLRPATTYRFSCRSTTITGTTTTANSTMEPGGGIGEALVFTTDDTPDTTAPRILDTPRIVGTTDEGFTVRWTTDEASDSYVTYGVAGVETRFTHQDNRLTTDHIVTIRGLRPEMDYDVAVSSADFSGNPAESAVPVTTMATTTADVDSTAPRLTVGPVVLSVFSRSAVLRWETNELASADVTLNITLAEVASVQAVPAAGTAQTLTLTNLRPGTTYGYTVRVVDQNQNQTTANGQFTTQAAGLTVTPSRALLKVGDTLQLTATSDDPAITRFQFGSENSSIATVSASGRVTGVAAGQVNIVVATQAGDRFVVVPVSVFELDEPSDASGFFALLAIFLIQDGDSGVIGPCFIATAASGTPLAGEIDVLRTFRDEWLLSNGPGTLFVDAYYRLSPPLADTIARSPVLAAATRVLLVPVLILAALCLKYPMIVALALALAAGSALALRRARRTRRVMNP